MFVKYDFSVDNLEGLKQHLNYVQSLSNMQKDRSFQKYIQAKCLSVVKQVTEQKLTGRTTNDEWIEEYKSNHKIREFNDGFVLYNDTTIPTSMLSTKHLENYPDGFSIALAFEYGIGIIGQTHPVAGAWEYNLKDYNFGWYYKKYEEILHTYGYSGFEIYRNAANLIEELLPDWVKEYSKKRKEV